MQADISHIFTKYVGREVPMKEERRRLRLENLGIDEEMTELRPAAPADPTLEEIRKDAARFGLSLRVWWPGIVGTMEINPDRVNVHIRKGDDGKWRIGDDISIDASRKLRETFASIIAAGVKKDVRVGNALKLRRNFI